MFIGSADGISRIFGFPFLVLWLRNWLTFVPSGAIVEALVLGAISLLPIAYFFYNNGIKVSPLN